MAAFAFPSFTRVRRDGAIQNARHAVTATLSLARATAVGYGRVAAFRVDTANVILWVEVDTSRALDRSGLITKGRVDLGEELGISIRSDNDRICFDGRGLGVSTSTCPVPGARIELVHSSRVDTVVVSSVGRVRHAR